MTLTMRMVRGADGSVRHVPTPYIVPVQTSRGKPKRVVPDPIKTNGESAAEQLRLLIERIERIREEKRAIADDEREIFSEAKSNGYDLKGLRAILTIRQTEKQDFEEHEGVVETYLIALGMR